MVPAPYARDTWRRGEVAVGPCSGQAPIPGVGRGIAHDSACARAREGRCARLTVRINHILGSVSVSTHPYVPSIHTVQMRAFHQSAALFLSTTQRPKLAARHPAMRWPCCHGCPRGSSSTSHRLPSCAPKQTVDHQGSPGCKEVVVIEDHCKACDRPGGCPFKFCPFSH